MSKVSPPPRLHLTARSARLSRRLPQGLWGLHLRAVRQHALLPIRWKTDPEDILSTRLHRLQRWFKVQRQEGGSWCESVLHRRTQTGWDVHMHLYHIKGGVGSILGVLEHLLVSVKRVVTAGTVFLFNVIYIFFPVPKKRLRSFIFFCSSFLELMLCGKSKM